MCRKNATSFPLQRARHAKRSTWKGALFPPALFTSSTNPFFHQQIDTQSLPGSGYNVHFSSVCQRGSTYHHHHHRKYPHTSTKNFTNPLGRRPPTSNFGFGAINASIFSAAPHPEPSWGGGMGWKGSLVFSNALRTVSLFVSRFRFHTLANHPVFLDWFNRLSASCGVLAVTCSI